MAKNNFYAVKAGLKPGIYTTWAEASKQVTGVKGLKVEYKGFKTEAEAQAFMDGTLVPEPSTKKKKQKWYGVASKFPEYSKVFDNYDEAQAHGSLYGQARPIKGFLDKQDAINYSQKKKGSKYSEFICEKDKHYIFIDGSFNQANMVYGYGLLVIQNDEVIYKEGRAANNEKWAASWNVAGELMAGMSALHVAKKMGLQNFEIVYDYVGIEKNYKKIPDKKGLTRYYGEYTNKYVKENGLKFKYTKVPAHSHYRYNEMVDELAAKAISEFIADLDNK